MGDKSIKEAIFFGLLLNEKAEKVEHRLKTKECPTIPQLERRAMPGWQWNLSQLLHTKICPYCQLTIKLFRREMGIEPWWKQQHESAQAVITFLTRLQVRLPALASASSGRQTLQPALCTTPAVVLYPEQRQQAEIDIITADYVDGCLVLRIRMNQIGERQEQLFLASQMPIELTLVSHPEGEPLETLFLPDLIEDDEVRVKVQIPPAKRAPLQEWHEQYHAALREERAEKAQLPEFPVRFILRPGVNDLRAGENR